MTESVASGLSIRAMIGIAIIVGLILYFIFKK